MRKAAEEKMSDLNQIQGLIDRGDKQNAMALLASGLLKDKNDIDAWLLLGELIDDPSKKKDCYHWVLKLSPDHPQAVKKLQELEELPPENRQIVVSPADQEDYTRPTKQRMQAIQFIPNTSTSPPDKESKDRLDIVGYVIAGVAAFLLIFNVIVNPGNFSNDINIIYVAIIFIGLIVGIVILSVTSKHRG